MTLKRWLGSLALVAITVTGSYWASLKISVDGLKSGIQNGDVTKLQKYIDWLAIRKELRSDMKELIAERISQNLRGQDENSVSIFGMAISGAFVPTIGNHLIDEFVTPKYLSYLLKHRKSPARYHLEFTPIGFTDFDEYTLRLGPAGTKIAKRPKIILRREGLIWRVVNVTFPAGRAPWETKEDTTGLAFRNVAPERRGDGLVITGQIVNTGKHTKDVPKLDVILRDANKNPVESKILGPPKGRLLPGEVEQFTVSFNHSPDAAVDVAVRFAPP